MEKAIKKKIKRSKNLFYKTVRRFGDLLGIVLLLIAVAFALRIF
jgi:hypothetical protein